MKYNQLDLIIKDSYNNLLYKHNEYEYHLIDLNLQEIIIDCIYLILELQVK